jgi:hypothetical protein
MSNNNTEARTFLALQAVQRNPKLAPDALHLYVRSSNLDYVAAAKVSKRAAIGSQSNGSYLIGRNRQRFNIFSTQTRKDFLHSYLVLKK